LKLHPDTKGLAVIATSQSTRAVLCCALILLGTYGSGCASKKPATADYNVGDKRNVIMSSADAPGLKTVNTCPAGMVLIPAGPSLLRPPEENSRTSEERGEVKPVHAFCVDRFEWPNRNNEPPTRSVTWIEARDLCGKAGKQLCSEIEFEKACRGPVGTRFTYGDGFADKVCPTANAEYIVGASPACVSGFGVHDMSGGVFEWTSTAPADNSAQRYLRGGMSAENPQLPARCTYRVRYTSSAANRDVGFRCCAPVVSKPAPKE